MICIYGVGCVPIWLVSILIFLGLSVKEAIGIVTVICLLFLAYCFYRFYKQGCGVVGSIRRMLAVPFDIIAGTAHSFGNVLRWVASKIAGDK